MKNLFKKDNYETYSQLFIYQESSFQGFVYRSLPAFLFHMIPPSPIWLNDIEEADCYGLEACVSPKCMCWNPTTLIDDFGYLGGDE